MHLAKEVATLQELSGGRFTLGVGMGWHRDEFDFMGVEFKNRSRRADEAIRLMHALWKGERDFEGEYWSFITRPRSRTPRRNRRSGSAAARSRAIRRVLELGDAWHPLRGSDANDVLRVKVQHPELRVIPRVAPEHVEAMLEPGAEGAVVQFADEVAMRDFARRLG
jgi:alkanesulfonate monooxygenase SsuD/methylene tetrahydromethanopterin reductase-like flavin-dependent oxidoreductase (luciferase family)